MKRLKDKVVIITGAAQGIGASLAKGLAAERASVVVADILSDDSVVEEITAGGRRALSVHCDVTSPESIERLVAATLDEFGRIDGVVNNAALFGTLQLSSLFDISIDEWDRTMAVNARGPWLMARATIPAMQETGGGSIVNVASNRVFLGSPNLLHYDASKGAVVAMTRSMAREVGATGVRVNCLAPGLTMSENVLKKDGIADRASAIAAQRPLSRNQEPEDLIGATLFLIGDESASITGQTLVVDGGSFMH